MRFPPIYCDVCIWKPVFYRITWSGNFRLESQQCEKCLRVREISIKIPHQKSTYPSKEWIKI